MPEKGKLQTRTPKENKFPTGQASSVPQKESEAPFGAQQGKYLYCILKDPKPEQARFGAGKKSRKFEIKGVEGKDVYSICEGKLSAVVSDSEVKEYFLTRENLLTHQKVIEEIFKKHNILPIGFGVVAPNSQVIREKILKPEAKELLTALEEVEGKIELGLKALWLDMKSIFQEIAETSQAIQNLKKSKNPSYQEKISAGQLVAELLEKKRETEKEEILEPLKKIAYDFKENKIFGEDMILNTAFLVKKNKEREFDKAVMALRERYDQRIKLMYVGPLPPFNFVDLHLSI